MFDFEDFRSVSANPLIAIEFVKSLSAYDLLQAVKKTNNDDDQSILDIKAVIDGVIELNDDEKLLLVATQSSFGGCHELIPFIFAKGIPYQAAILSNSRIDWYGFFTFNGDGFINKNLDDIIAEDSVLAETFYKNQRMDRRLMAAIIRGKTEIRTYFDFDLSNAILQAEGYSRLLLRPSRGNRVS